MAKAVLCLQQASIDPGKTTAIGDRQPCDFRLDRDSVCRQRTSSQEFPSTISRSELGGTWNIAPRIKILLENNRPNLPLPNNLRSNLPARRLRAPAANDENRHSTRRR